MTGYRALHESAAWFDISDRGRIKVAGKDRVRFIHAMSTNNVEKLCPGEGIQTLFLNGRGHIQAEVLALITQEYLLLDFDAHRRKSLPLHLAKYIVMDDVSLEEVDSSLSVIAIEGPQAEQVMSTIATVPPPGKLNHVATGGHRIVRHSLSGGPGFWLSVPSIEKEAWIRQVESASALPADKDAWQTVRVENRIPLDGIDYPDKSIPQQAGRLCAVSFSKGCYLGQEIVERVRSRGNPQRTLEGLEVESSDLPAPDSPVIWCEKEIGRLTSPVFSPTIGKVLAFALLKNEVPRDGLLTVDGHKARIRQ